MYIRDINLCKGSGVVRAEAHVAWEESDKAPLVLFVETDVQFEDAVWADPNAFVVGCLLPAWHAGEQRVKIDGALCPMLCHNLKAAMMTLQSWYPEMGPPPTIEPSHGFRALSPFRAQAASFLSCGVDSLATLRANKLHVPSDHPTAIQAVLLVDFIEASFMSEQEARNLNRLSAALEVAADAGVRPIPVKTNILRLDGDGWFFTYKWHAAVFSSVAHCLSRGFNKVYIASSYDAAHLEPWGSHPLLDTYYSSAHLQIEHHGVWMSRVEKTALVANWPIGLQNILVCQGKESGRNNCGACEKCIRTMTALVALGKLKGCRSFPVDDVSPELLNTVRECHMIYNDSQASYYSELLPALRACGREDLVTVIQQILRSSSQDQLVSDLTTSDVEKLIPKGDTFILVAKDRFGCNIAAERKGHCWGSPPDSRTAIRELEWLRRSGANFIVFRPSALWWLDYYTELHRYLHANFRRIVQDDRLVVFDLRR